MDDIQIHARAKSRKLVGELPQIFLELKREVGEVKLDLPFSEEVVEGKGKLEVSKRYWTQKLQHW